MLDFVSLCLVFPCPYLVFLSSLVHLSPSVFDYSSPAAVSPDYVMCL